MPFVFSPLPHTEARERIAGLPLVSREVMDGLLPGLRAYAFAITGLDVGDQMAKARDMIAAVPAGDKTWDKARKEIAAELDDALGGKVAQRRAELLLRTHVFRSYAAARYRNLMAQVDVFPFWQYKTHGDGNVRPSHAALNGKIFPAGHDIWQRIFPPWDWGCRCLVVPLTKRAAERVLDRGRISDADAKAAHLLPTQIATPEAFTDREATLIDKNQRLPNGVPLNRTPTWSDSPWSEPGNIQHDWELIRKRYADQPEVLEAFEQWAKKTAISDVGMTVDEWLGLPEAETRRMVRDFRYLPFDELEEKGLLPDAFKGMNPGRKRKGKAALFDDVPGVKKTREMRLRENAWLRKHALPRKSPPSKNVTTAANDAHDLAMQKAALLQDAAHDDGGMKRVVMGRDVKGAANAGEYNPASGIHAATADVREGIGTPLLTSLHELGHHLEEMKVPLDMRGAIAAASQSGSVDFIRQFVSSNRDYYLRPDEMWGRAYAQYVALKSGDAEALAELNAVLADRSKAWLYWTKADWIPIEDAITLALQQRGWL